MAGFDKLKINPGESLAAVDWNALVEKVENLKLQIAPNLSKDTLSLGSKAWLLKAHPASGSEPEKLTVNSLIDEQWAPALSIQKGTGHVGIGTTNPKEAFQIGDRWTFHNGGAKYIAYNSEWNGNDDARLEDGPASQVRFNSNGSIELLTAKSGKANEAIGFHLNLTASNDGRVGIGAYNPSSKLQVNGHIYSTEGFKFPDSSIQTSAVKIQSGVYKLATNLPKIISWARVLWKKDSAPIELSAGFKVGPHIICSIEELDIKGDRKKLIVRALSISKSRFKIRIETGKGTFIYKLKIRWLAIGR